MKIKSIALNGFKRFTETTVGEIPSQARLVLVAGPNGSGKSSLFDAVNVWRGMNGGHGGWDDNYHQKKIPGLPFAGWSATVALKFHEPQPADSESIRKALYVRSAYRNDPEFRLDHLSRMPPALSENRLVRLIDNDQAVSQNYRRLVSEGIEYAYEQGGATETLQQFRDRSIGEIRRALERLFPGLELNGLGNPFVEGTFHFDKGDSKKFRYMNLSGGEKAAFDLILDILIKRREFDDTAFFIDEPEAHMSAALQADLLSELFTLVPNPSQLWLATHSIGMMRKALELSQAFPGEVVFLDFDGANFDVPTVVAPTLPDRPFWKRALSLALHDLAGYVAPEQVVLCEGAPMKGGSPFDADCYNAIFGIELPAVVFLGAGNAHEIESDARGVSRLLQAIAPSAKMLRLIDRDDRTDEDIAKLRAQGVRVLHHRNIESYLLDDEVLIALCAALGDARKGRVLKRVKACALRKSVAAGGPPDDLKRVAGHTYVAAKKLFPNVKLGNNARSFMRGFCAPEIRPGTDIYVRLKNDVFG